MNFLHISFVILGYYYYGKAMEWKDSFQFLLEIVEKINKE